MAAYRRGCGHDVAREVASYAGQVTTGDGGGGGTEQVGKFGLHVSEHQPVPEGDDAVGRNVEVSDPPAAVVGRKLQTERGQIAVPDGPGHP